LLSAALLLGATLGSAFGGDLCDFMGRRKVEKERKKKKTKKKNKHE